MPEEVMPKILRRLKSIEGHVRGVSRMVENGSYCIDIVNQTLAIERALEKINHLVLDHHLHTCVSAAMKGRNTKERERVIQEIVQVFQAKGR